MHSKSKRSKKLRVRKAMIILVIVISILLLIAYRIGDAIDTPIAQAKSNAIVVQTIPATKADLNEWIRATGTAQAVRKKELRFEVPGYVDRMGLDTRGESIREGSIVLGPRESTPQGDLLLAVDSEAILRSVERLESHVASSKLEVSLALKEKEKVTIQLQLAEAAYLRSQNLVNNQAISQSTADDEQSRYLETKNSYDSMIIRHEMAQIALKANEAELAQAKWQLEKTALRAPFNGIVTELNVKIDQYASFEIFEPGSESFTTPSAAVVIIDPSEFEVLLQLPIEDGLKIEEGQFAEIESISNGKLRAKSNAQVYSISPAIRSTFRNINAIVRTNTPNELIDGEYTNIRVKTQNKKGVVAIRKDAILYDEQNPYVFVIENGIAAKRSLTIGLSENQLVEVTHGLSIGEQVVTAGKNRVTEGSEVIISDRLNF